MEPGQYPTSGDARVFINEHWVDDTLRCDVDVQHRKIPLFGYHQKHYADMASGKVLVTGSLMIHFRFPGYLMYAIGKTLSRQAIDAYNEREHRHFPGTGVHAGPENSVDPTYIPPPNGNSSAHLIETINELRQLDSAGRIDRLMRATNEGEFNRISDILDALYSDSERAVPGGRGNSVYADPVEMSPSDFTGGSKGFQIDIVYNRAQDTYGRGFKIRERVMGVHLTGRRKVLNASTTSGDLGSSGSSLVEIYPFVARNVERVVTEYDITRIHQDVNETDTGYYSQEGSAHVRHDVDPYGTTVHAG